MSIASNKIDLHIHSAVSDGSDTVSQLYQKIKTSNIHTFSVTDHDTIDGTLEMEQLVSKDDSLTFIRGIEFSCITPIKKCHILGYGFNPSNQEFLDALNMGILLRQDKTKKRIDYWKNECNIELTQEESDWLYAIKSPAKPHFGQIIVKRGLAPDLKTAIEEFVSPCKTGNDRIDASIAIRAIRNAGGIAIWAHPFGGEGEKRLTREAFSLQLEELLSYGLQGLECYYSRYSLEDIAFLLKEAKKHHLFISAGSDYHGSIKSNIPIGKLNANGLPVNENELSIYHYIKTAPGN